MTEPLGDRLRPMPDDLEYGRAAALAAWTDGGREVAHVLASRGEVGTGSLEPAECGPLRGREQRASVAVVGVSTVEFPGHRDGVIEYGVARRRDIAAAIRPHRPEPLMRRRRPEHPGSGGRGAGRRGPEPWHAR